MSDLISRDMVYNLLRRECSTAVENFIVPKIKRLPSIQSAPQWIPCSDVPDTGRNVFIARGGKTMMTVCIGHFNHDYKQWYEDRNWFAKGVYDGLYWCEMPPLPEPWEGDSNG